MEEAFLVPLFTMEQTSLLQRVQGRNHTTTTALKKYVELCILKNKVCYFKGNFILLSYTATAIDGLNWSLLHECGKALTVIKSLSQH